jgi:hypothetical protein
VAQRQQRQSFTDLRLIPIAWRILLENQNSNRSRNNSENNSSTKTKSRNEPCMSGRKSVFDEYPFAFTSQRNYCERHPRGEKVKTSWVSAPDLRSGFWAGASTSAIALGRSAKADCPGHEIPVQQILPVL